MRFYPTLPSDRTRTNAGDIIVICGGVIISQAVSRLPGERPAISQIGKPPVEEDAYDVVSARG